MGEIRVSGGHFVIFCAIIFLGMIHNCSMGCISKDLQEIEKSIKNKDMHCEPHKDRNR